MTDTHGTIQDGPLLGYSVGAPPFMESVNVELIGLLAGLGSIVALVVIALAAAHGLGLFGWDTPKVVRATFQVRS